MHKKFGLGNRHLPHGLNIIHEDKDLLVVEKPSGLLTIAAEKDKIKTVYHYLTDYVRKGCAKSRNRIFIVHRLDRETSGLLIFAKNFMAKEYLQTHWEDAYKKYLAVVYDKCSKKEDTITTLLAENTAHVVYVTADTSKGKQSQTAYRVLKEAKGLSLLEINLLTGRKHQIRVHMSYIGHPVVGDKKYGKQPDRFKRLALHAKMISFIHPVSRKRVTFETPVPEYFTQLIS